MSIKRYSIEKQFNDPWKVIFDISLIAIMCTVGHFMRIQGAAQGMIVGGIVGIFLHWRATEKSSVNFKTNLVPHAKTWLEMKGYIFNQSKNEYIPNIHRLLRFDSQNIKFERISDSCINMVGPYYILKMFLKNMKSP